jgi:hypothetical protein
VTAAPRRSKKQVHTAGSGPSKVYKIDADYDNQAIKVVKEQLARAAVRLAWTLKENL